ncbi:hypothetical protein ABZ543_08395 [Streptomyces roseifaciens]
MLSPVLLTHWTRALIFAARTDDGDLIEEITRRIARQGDALDLIAVCRVIADTAQRALLALYGPPDAARGEVWALEYLDDPDEDPETLFAARLVTAYANRDNDHVTAFVAAVAAAPLEQRAESLWSLVAYAVGLEAQATRQGSRPYGRNTAITYLDVQTTDQTPPPDERNPR